MSRTVMSRTVVMARERSGERGFTFIEVLVVMGIIAVLAGLTVVSMNLIIRRKPQFATEARVSKLKGTVEQWRQRFDRYPPSDPTRLRKIAGGAENLPAMPDTFNVGIEALYQALYWPTFNGDPALNDEELSNTDGDEFDKPTSQGKTVYEIKDDWGNPLVYFVHTDYAKADASPPSYLNFEGEEVTPRPWKYTDEGRGFAEPRGVQIYSMGEDGQPNTDDDVKSWE